VFYTIKYISRPIKVIANVSCFEQSTFYATIKIFDNFPPRLTILKNEKTKFKASVRKYVHPPFIM